ncbi:MAG TPA: DUF131 domain-containing protein [Thermoplasmata archaeon]|nr:DUF131 domain-containing protein [Thermoplasmata archaeon]
MRLRLLGAIAILAVGVALIVVSVFEGRASVSLLVIFPVISGSSLTFLLGVVFLIVGFFSLPFALSDGWESAPPSSSNRTAPPSNVGSGVGGFVLIGPVPFVFGSWKGISRRARWALALSGAVLFLVVLVVFLFVW